MSTVVQYYQCQDGTQVAYQKIEGQLPGIMFLGGFMSDMFGTKASYLADYCQKKGQAFIRFDYLGHGLSKGDFKECTLGRWKQDALTIFDNLTQGSQILVGSSMGGWIMLLLAHERISRIKGLVGIAAAPDFTDTLIEEMSPAHRQALETTGIAYIPHHTDAPYLITRALIEEAKQYHILDTTLNITCPVRLLHGTKDKEVSWMRSLKLLDCLQSTDATLTLIKDGDHRLSTEAHLKLLTRIISEI